MTGWSRSLGKIWGSKVGGQKAGQAGAGVCLLMWDHVRGRAREGRDGWVGGPEASSCADLVNSRDTVSSPARPGLGEALSEKGGSDRLKRRGSEQWFSTRVSRPLWGSRARYPVHSDTYIAIHKLGGAQEYTKDIQDHGLRGGSSKEGGRQHAQVDITSSRMAAYCPPQ